MCRDDKRKRVGRNGYCVFCGKDSAVLGRRLEMGWMIGGRKIEEYTMQKQEM